MCDEYIICNLCLYVSSVTPFFSVRSFSYDFQATKVILFSNSAAFTPLSNSYHNIPSSYEHKSSTRLWNTHNFDPGFPWNYFFSPAISNCPILMSFAPKRFRKVKYSGTSSSTCAIKRCFHFSGFRYGFPVHVTYKNFTNDKDKILRKVWRNFKQVRINLNIFRT